MAKALHPFIHDGRQYYAGDEVLATGEELVKLQILGNVEESIKTVKPEKVEPKPVDDAAEVIEKVKKTKKGK